METKELTCICCPMGCRLTAEIDGTNIRITGNTCKRGAEYGVRELTDPTRVVTGTVRMANGKPCPAKTVEAVKKAKIFDVLAEMKTIHPAPPIAIGDVLAENIAGTGVSLVATGNRE